jgi:hypothetical protein
MTVRLTDTIIGKSRGSVQAAMAYAMRAGSCDLDFLLEMFTELWRLCQKYGFAFEYLVGQSKNETAAWSCDNPNWANLHNPGGLAITNAQNLSLKYKTGKDAARALVAHHYVYRYGAIPDDTELYAYRALDGHYDAVVNGINAKAQGGDGKPFAGSIRTIGDFNVNGRWCLLDRNNTPTGPLNDYGNRILRDTIAVFGQLADQQPFDPPVTTPSTGEEPVAAVFGNVPHPFYQDRIISNSSAWNDLGKRGGKCVVWHRMYGTLWGTDGYFRGEASGKALTDYGVGVTATDGAGQAGVILRWNDPFGRRAPWASGPVTNPIGDGAKFVNLYGINAVNRDGVSIEISGDGGTGLDAKARASVVALTAYFADQYGKVLAAKGKQFDYTTFPIIPDEDGRSFVCYHGEFYDGKRNTCPGAVVTAATDGMLAEVKAILKQYQSGGVVVDPPTEPVYAAPQKPAAGDSVVNGRIFLAHTQEYVAKKDVTPRIYADPGSDPTGPDIKKGAKVKTTHVVSDVGESADLTAVIEDGSRIPIKEVLV